MVRERETEVMREIRGDGDTLYLKADGDIEIKNLKLECFADFFHFRCAILISAGGIGAP
jgi:hypothetical protein